jgi:hypothetical protein
MARATGGRARDAILIKQRLHLYMSICRARLEMSRKIAEETIKIIRMAEIMLYMQSIFTPALGLKKK